MSIYLRLGGAGLILISALLISREYAAYLERRIAEYRGLAALLAHAEGMIDRFLCFGRDLWRGFRDDVLEKCGLLAILREEGSLSEAFDMCKGKMSLSSDAKAWISDALSGLGTGYKEGEISRLSDLSRRIIDECESEIPKAEKSVKVARALLIGGALTLGILLI